VARLENTFSWSASRDRLFRDCRRAYYYSYYGSWGGWDRRADARARRLYYLKNLTSLPMWIGSRVHDTVEALLREVRGGRLPDAEAAAERMVERMRGDYADSRRDRALDDPKNAVRFFEHHYGPEPARERWAAERDAAVGCVLTFGGLDFLPTLDRLGPEAFLALEDLEKWDFEGTPVFVRLDLAYQDGDRTIHVVDWKTGRRKNPANPLQMLGYAAYATEAWGAEPDRLAVREVYLRLAEDPENRCAVDEEELEKARERIRRSIEEMRSLLAKPEANEAREEDFALTDDPRVCRYCFFRELCPDPRG
jgi:hypothetical protein